VLFLQLRQLLLELFVLGVACEFLLVQMLRQLVNLIFEIFDVDLVLVLLLFQFLPDSEVLLLVFLLVGLKLVPQLVDLLVFLRELGLV
jgi:hypothetical protein